MALYLIGDVQGCDAPLGRLLATLAFSPSRDTLYLRGDLGNRGPGSDAVLRRLMGYGGAARCLLGNHDLSLLAVAYGHRAPHRNDTMDVVLPAPEAEEVGRGPKLATFLPHMYGNEPAQWSESLQGPDRLRVIVNAFTRLRFCTPEGAMHLKATGGPDQAPPGTMPWFDVPGRKTGKDTIAFGHWSTLGYLRRPDLISLDTGCVWGGCLSALRLSPDGEHELVQVGCEQSQAPG